MEHKDKSDFEDVFLKFLRKLYVLLLTRYLEKPTISAVKGDILKLNVNGAEREIFSEDSHYQSWLPYTKVLIIELHDRMKRDCSHNFFHAISWYDYFFMQAEDNLIFIREDLL